MFEPTYAQVSSSRPMACGTDGVVDADADGPAATRRPTARAHTATIGRSVMPSLTLILNTQTSCSTRTGVRSTPGKTS